MLNRERIVNRLLSAPRGIRCKLRVATLRWLGMRIGRRCWLRAISIPRNPWDIALSDHVALDDGVVLLTSGPNRKEPKLQIGERVYVNRMTMFDASERIEVGAGCMIGPYVYVTDHDHKARAGQPLAAQPLVSAPVVIGENAWIGAHAVILRGVTIGRDAVIGAGAVVTRDVPAGAVALGVPARPTRDTLAPASSTTV